MPLRREESLNSLQAVRELRVLGGLGVVVEAPKRADARRIL